MHRFVVGAAVVLGTLSAAGCGDSTGPEQGVIGTFELRTANGAPLPYRRQSGSIGSVLELTDGEVQIHTGGTCMVTLVHRKTDPRGTATTQTNPISCTYVADAPTARESTVSLMLNGAIEALTAVYRDDQLTFTMYGDLTLVFQS